MALREVSSPDFPIGIIYVVEVVDYESVPIPVIRRHPHRTRGDRIEEDWQIRRNM